VHSSFFWKRAVRKHGKRLIGSLVRHFYWMLWNKFSKISCCFVFSQPSSAKVCSFWPEECARARVSGAAERKNATGAKKAKNPSLVMAAQLTAVSSRLQQVKCKEEQTSKVNLMMIPLTCAALVLTEFNFRKAEVEAQANFGVRNTFCPNYPKLARKVFWGILCANIFSRTDHKHLLG